MEISWSLAPKVLHEIICSGRAAALFSGLFSLSAAEDSFVRGEGSGRDQPEKQHRT